MRSVLLLRLLALAMLWAEFSTAALYAQKKPKENAEVLVALRVAAFNATDTFMARFVVAGKWSWGNNQSIPQGTYSPMDRGPWSPQTSSGWSQGAVATVPLTPNVAYEFAISGTWSYGEIKLSAPAGYQIYINDVPGGIYRTPDFAGGFGGPVCSLVLRPLDVSNSLLPAGEALSPQVGDMIWQISAGSTDNGLSAGAVQWRTPTFSADLLDPTALTAALPGSTSNLVTYNSDTGIDDVYTNQFHLTLVRNSPGTPGYSIEIRYPPYDTLTRRYIVSQPDSTWQNRIHIDKNELNETGGIESSKSWTIAKNGSNWTITEAAGDRLTTLNSSPNGSGSRIETIEVKDTGSTVASQLTRTYQDCSWGQEELVSEVADPAGLALTTSYAYFNNGASSSYGRLQSVTRSDGSWERYDYDDTFAGWGNLIATYRPWQDSPASPSAATASNCQATLYSFATDYAADNSALCFADLPAGFETKINGTTTAKTTISCSAHAPAPYPNYDNRIQLRTIQTWSASGASTTTSRWDYHRWTVSEPYRSAFSSQNNPDGTMVSALRYRAEFWNYGDNPATKFYTRPETPAGIIWGEYRFNGFTSAVQDAVYVDHFDGRYFDPVYMVPNRSTIGLEIYLNGHVWFRASFVFTGASGGLASFTYIGMEELGYTNGLQTYKYSPTGYQEQELYDGLYRSYATKNDGTEISYAHDNLGREYLATKLSLGSTSEYASQGSIYTHKTFDAAGRVLTEKISSNANAGSNPADAVQTTRIYNKAGLLTSETAESTGGSFVTTYSYSNGARTVTATMPNGATKITDKYLDGSTKSIAGTGLVAQYYTATVNSDGTITRQTTVATSGGARWIKTTTDWVGRTSKEEKPAYGSGTFVKEYTYSAVGQLTKTTETGLAPTITDYDAWQKPYRTGLHFGTGDHLVTSSLDRITETDSIFEQDGSGVWWIKQTTKGYNQDNNGTPVTQSVTRTRLTAFSNFAQSETKTTDIFGNQTQQIVSVQRYSTNAYINDVKLVTETTTYPNSSTPEIKVTRNGLLQKQQSRQGLVSRMYYDVRGRLTKQTSPRTDTNPNDLRTGYATNSDRVAWTKDTAGNQATFGYDSAGRQNAVTNPQGKSVYQSFNSRNQVTRTWGAATDPVEYTFDDYGQQTAMSTFRGGTGWDQSTWPSNAGTADTTTWAFENATGLLTSKTDASNYAVSYTYNARGQLLTRTWSRGTVTTYAYSSTTAEQIGITYSDSTPALSYTYNRLGQTVTVGDVTGTRTFAYSPTTTLLSSETLPSYFGGRVLSRNYDTTTTGALGRATGFALSGASGSGSDYSVSYGYDGYGRFSALTSGFGPSYAYSYTANSNLIGSISDSVSGWTETMAYNANRDLLTSVDGQFGTAHKAKFEYTYDSLGRRTSVLNTGEIFSRYGSGAGSHIAYGYNDRSEVTAATAYEGNTLTDTSDGSALGGRTFGYAYDNIGNRATATSGTQRSDSSQIYTTSYTANSLNQYTQRTVPATTYVTGLAPTNATVTVNGNTASRLHDYFYAAVTQSNSSAAQWVNTTSSSTYGGSASRFMFLPKTPEVYTYDLDGNLTSDGRWDYTWDAENRLVAMQTHTALSPSPIANADARRLEFTYDYLGRRVRKVVSSGYNGTGFATVALDRKFVYDGWNLITDRNGTTLATVTSYVWGLDLTRTLQDGGGVGGLLAVVDQTGSAVVHQAYYDGNGNVHGLVCRTNGALTAGSVTAAYEYSAFGETLRATGTYAQNNPFRFSTKYIDDEAGLIYYGRRYYSPSQGRFFGRDPIEEKGGLHLYAFGRNNSINGYDNLGGIWISITMNGDGFGTSVSLKIPGKWDPFGLFGNAEESPFDQTRYRSDDGLRWSYFESKKDKPVVSNTQQYTATITFSVSFDSSIANQSEAEKAVKSNLDAMQEMFNNGRLSYIKIVYQQTQAEVKAPASYVYDTRGEATEPKSIFAKLLRDLGGEKSGVIPLIITDNAILAANSDPVAVTLRSPEAGIGVIARWKEIPFYLNALAHEAGHFTGYTFPGASPLDPMRFHSDERTNVMYDPLASGFYMDIVYRTQMERFAVPIK